MSRAKISLVPVPEDRPDYRLEGLVASLYFAALLGIAGAAPINYVLGRRVGLALFAIFVFAGHFMYMFANSLGLLLGARVVTGIGKLACSRPPIPILLSIAEPFSRLPTVVFTLTRSPEISTSQASHLALYRLCSSLQKRLLSGGEAPGLRCGILRL